MVWEFPVRVSSSLWFSPFLTGFEWVQFIFGRVRVDSVNLWPDLVGFSRFWPGSIDFGWVQV